MQRAGRYQSRAAAFDFRAGFVVNANARSNFRLWSTGNEKLGIVLLILGKGVKKKNNKGPCCPRDFYNDVLGKINQVSVVYGFPSRW